MWLEYLPAQCSELENDVGNVETKILNEIDRVDNDLRGGKQRVLVTGKM